MDIKETPDLWIVCEKGRLRITDIEKSVLQFGFAFDN